MHGHVFTTNKSKSRGGHMLLPHLTPALGHERLRYSKEQSVSNSNKAVAVFIRLGSVVYLWNYEWE